MLHACMGRLFYIMFFESERENDYYPHSGMKNRLTKNLLIIVAIPLSFELALFSSCFLLINVAEQERALETDSIAVTSKISPVMVSSLELLTLAIAYSIKDLRFEDPFKQSDSKTVFREIADLEEVGRQHPDYQKSIEALCKNSRELFHLVQKFKTTKDTRKDISKVLTLKDCIMGIEESANFVLDEIKEHREELSKTDSYVRNVIHTILWCALGISLLVAALGVAAFHRLLSVPLKELNNRARQLALGKRLEPAFESDDELGALSRAFETMADEVEKNRRLENAIYENTADIVLTIDEKNKITMLNDAIEENTGFRKSGFLNADVLKLIPDEEKSTVEKQLSDIRERESYGSFESGILTASGHSIDVVWSVRWSNKDEILFCTVNNIDYERKTERLSKDLRTILASDLKRNLENAHKTVDNLKKRGLQDNNKIKHLDSNLARLLPMLDKLNEAISSRSKELVLTKETTTTKRLVSNAVSAVEALLKDKNIAIEDSVEDIQIYVDSSQIERVLINLLSNAIKVSRKDSETEAIIKVRAGYLTKDDETVVFEVEDQGPGIPLNAQSKLFQRYYQPKVHESREGKGSGLGLYSAQNIVENHGGRIGVMSDGKTGTTFWFHLPRGRSA